MLNLYDMKACSKLFLLAVFFLFFSFPQAFADNEGNESWEGYDENTEITISGTLADFGREMRGPVIVMLRAGAKDYRVITGPPWFISEQGFEFQRGRLYEITGSKFFSRDGQLLLVASRMKDLSTGKVIRFRDSDCMPVWKGRRMMRGMH
ncbi:MAG TPA: hypothetical protein VK452_09335 [Dissulfurispiraceae bacterium]|nr:hypothetical protein [Dissulfurispiraceae bacterium]